jgi:hypothetical protein
VLGPDVLTALGHLAEEAGRNLEHDQLRDAVIALCGWLIADHRLQHVELADVAAGVCAISALASRPVAWPPPVGLVVAAAKPRGSYRVRASTPPLSDPVAEPGKQPAHDQCHKSEHGHDDDDNHQHGADLVAAGDGQRHR